MTRDGGARVLRGVALAGTLAACSGGARDALAPSQDVVVGGGPSTRTAEGYEYVARRPLAVVALAEARGLPTAVTRAAIDRLADALDTCVTEQGVGRAAPRGAARVVAEVGDDGGITGVSLRIDPGAAAPAVALLCLVAPVKLLSFPLADAGARGLAVEALWGAPSAAAQP
jgi:hypothetical protein